MQPSFGSGTNLLGASAGAILGMPGAMQQSPASSGYQPGVLPSTPTPPHPQQSTIGTQLPQAPQMPSIGAPGPISQPQGVVGLPPGNPEALSIIKALTSRLTSITKAEDLQKGL